MTDGEQQVWAGQKAVAGPNLLGLRERPGFKRGCQGPPAALHAGWRWLQAG